MFTPAGKGDGQMLTDSRQNLVDRQAFIETMLVIRAGLLSIDLEIITIELLKFKFPIQKIAAVTGLSQARIRKLNVQRQSPSRPAKRSRKPRSN